jgi:hypothetical protein
VRHHLVDELLALARRLNDVANQIEREAWDELYKEGKPEATPIDEPEPPADKPPPLDP